LQLQLQLKKGIPTQLRVALAVRIRIDCDVVGFAIRGSFRNCLESLFLVPGSTQMGIGFPKKM
jgi:hypothetical protein